MSLSIVLLLLGILCATSAQAQTHQARITGRVVDSAGAIIPGVQVVGAPSSAALGFERSADISSPDNGRNSGLLDAGWRARQPDATGARRVLRGRSGGRQSYNKRRILRV